MNLKRLLLGLTAALALHAACADDLETIQQRGELVVGVKDASPPFGIYNKVHGSYSGYDIDFTTAIAKRLGVRPVFRPVDSAERIPALQEGRVDMVVATLTRTPERERQVGLSYGYFVTGQKFLARTGKVKLLSDLAHARLGVVRGSTSEKAARQALPTATLESFDDYPEMIALLTAGKLDAISTDEPILAGLQARMPNREQFEVSSTAISFETYGIAVRSGQKRLLQQINQTLLDMEHTGEAARIFDRWFGSASSTPLLRYFRITR